MPAVGSNLCQYIDQIYASTLIKSMPVLQSNLCQYLDQIYLLKLLPGTPSATITTHQTL